MRRTRAPGSRALFGFTIFWEIGKTYRIKVTEDLGAATPRWVALGEVTLAAPVEMWFDTQPVTRVQRYYRAVER